MMFTGLDINAQLIQTFGTWGMFLFSGLLIWSMIWKGIGLWKAGRNNQIAWFVVMFLVNSAGILPIIYILWFQKKKAETIMLPKAEPKKKTKKK